MPHYEIKHLLPVFSRIETSRRQKSPLTDGGAMPELEAIGWLNSAPLERKSLRGKIVLVDFWTYTCINSLQPLPYLKSWGAKYKDAGLVVIGVHTPEFSFEKNRKNVEDAVRNLNVRYPVAIDSKPVRFKVTLDGKAPADDCGSDSAPDGTGQVQQPRLYQLIRQKGQIQDRSFEIEFLDPGVQELIIRKEHVWLNSIGSF